MMAIISLLPNLGAQAQLQANNTWDLARVFNSSTAVFYGEVLRTVPEPLYRTGVSGVHMQDIRTVELPLAGGDLGAGHALYFDCDRGI